jgi:PII-like signaling protein
MASFAVYLATSRLLGSLCHSSGSDASRGTRASDGRTGCRVKTDGSTGAVLKIGLWNSAAVHRGGLLYRELLRRAQAHGMAGATVWAHIEGSGRGGVFRSIENEAASNALPLWIEWVDEEERLIRWLPDALMRIRGEGVCAMEQARVWWKRPRSVSDQKVPAGTRGDGEPGAQRGAKRAWEAVPGVQVRVYSHEGVFVHGKPIYQAAAEWLRPKGVLWLATTRAAVGISEDGAVRAAGVLPFRQDAPIVITILDELDHAGAWLAEFQHWLGGAALIVSSEVTLYRSV